MNTAREGSAHAGDPAQAPDVSVSRESSEIADQIRRPKLCSACARGDGKRGGCPLGTACEDRIAIYDAGVADERARCIRICEELEREFEDAYRPHGPDTESGMILRAQADGAAFCAIAIYQESAPAQKSAAPSNAPQQALPRGLAYPDDAGADVVLGDER